MKKQSEKTFLTLYLLLFILFAGTLALYQPSAHILPKLPNPPDEHARFLVPWYIYQTGKLPTGFEEAVRIPGYGCSYALYTALPYIIQGLLMRFAGLFTTSKVILLYVARFVNVAFGTAMAAVVYLLSQRLFEDVRIRWVFCFAVTFLPESVFVHSYVNTDSMCMLSTAMIIYAWICMFQDGVTKNNSLWLAGGIILCALSYYNAYGYILSSVFVFLSFFFIKESGKLSLHYKEMLQKGSFIACIVLLGISWYFIRNYINLDGDFLGLATRDKMVEQFATVEFEPSFKEKGYTIFQMFREKPFFASLFVSFIAAYGSILINGNIWIYRIYKALGFLLAGSLLLLPPHKWENKAKKEHPFRALFLEANIMLCMVFPLVLLIYYAFATDYQDQGRYLLPGLIPLMYYLCIGLKKLCKLHISFPNGKDFTMPDVFTTIFCGFIMLFILFSIYHMVFMVSMPIYLETGMVV